MTHIAPLVALILAASLLGRAAARASVLCAWTKVLPDGAAHHTFLRRDSASPPRLYHSAWSRERTLLGCAWSDDASVIQGYVSLCRERAQEFSENFDLDSVLGSEERCVSVASAGAGAAEQGRHGGRRLARSVGGPPAAENSQGRDERSEVRTHRRVKRGFIVPGTLWCGSGNKAPSYEDLGVFADTDSCCREHDQCKHTILSFHSDFGVFNSNIFTMSHCDCDNKFRACLRGANDSISDVVGYTFFNLLKMHCFEFSHRLQCTQRNWFGMCKESKMSLYAAVHPPTAYESINPTEASMNSTSPITDTTAPAELPESSTSNPPLFSITAAAPAPSTGSSPASVTPATSVTSTSTAPAPSTGSPPASVTPATSVTSTSTAPAPSTGSSPASVSPATSVTSTSTAPAPSTGSPPASVTPATMKTTSTSTAPAPSTGSPPASVTPATSITSTSTAPAPSTGSPPASITPATSITSTSTAPAPSTGSPPASVTPATIKTTSTSTAPAPSTGSPPASVTPATSITSTSTVTNTLDRRTGSAPERRDDLENTLPTKNRTVAELDADITEMQPSCGIYKDLDECRSKILPQQKRYGLHNPEPRTLYHCNCTTRLFQALVKQTHLTELQALLLGHVSQSCFLPQDCTAGEICSAVLVRPALPQLDHRSGAEVEERRHLQAVRLKVRRPNSRRAKRKDRAVRLHKLCLRLTRPKRVNRTRTQGQSASVRERVGKRLL